MCVAATGMLKQHIMQHTQFFYAKKSALDVVDTLDVETFLLLIKTASTSVEIQQDWEKREIDEANICICEISKFLISFKAIAEITRVQYPKNRDERENFQLLEYEDFIAKKIKNDDFLKLFSELLKKVPAKNISSILWTLFIACFDVDKHLLGPMDCGSVGFSIKHFTKFINDYSNLVEIERCDSICLDIKDYCNLGHIV